MLFGVKIKFQKFSESFGLILLVQLAFWMLLIWTSCSPNLKLVLKSPWFRNNNSNLLQSIIASCFWSACHEMPCCHLTDFTCRYLTDTVNQSVTIKSGCITYRNLHVITNHNHQFTGHLISNFIMSDLSAEMPVNFLWIVPKTVCEWSPKSACEWSPCLTQLVVMFPRFMSILYYYGVRTGSKAAIPVHRYFFTGAPVKFSGGPVNITGAPLYFTGPPLYLPVDR